MTVKFLETQMTSDVPVPIRMPVPSTIDYPCHENIYLNNRGHKLASPGHPWFLLLTVWIESPFVGSSVC